MTEKPDTPGKLLREARKRHLVSQEQLAARAGTTQSAISRVENDRVSPSVETLRELLFLCGEGLEIDSRPRDFGIDRSLIRANLKLSPEERLRRGLEFSRTLLEDQLARRARGAA